MKKSHQYRQMKIHKTEPNHSLEQIGTTVYKFYLPHL